MREFLISTAAPDVTAGDISESNLRNKFTSFTAMAQAQIPDGLWGVIAQPESRGPEDRPVRSLDLTP